jgi:Tol biopolymer transport system component
VFLGGEHGTLPGEGTFSPDGKWLAFTEYSAGKREVYITSFPGKSGKWQVSVDGGHYPRWRRDGKELFFLRADNANVMVTPTVPQEQPNKGFIFQSASVYAPADKCPAPPPTALQNPSAQCNS